MNHTIRILIVEDEAAQRQVVADILSQAGYLVHCAEHVDEAEKHLLSQTTDIVLSDWKLPDRDGMQLLQWLRQQDLDCAFIMATAYGTISHAVDAMQAGADDYLAKPFDRHTLLLTIQKVSKTRQLSQENKRLNEALTQRDQLVDMIGQAPAMQRVFSRVMKVAATHATVLITGETGTGKELAARALHTLSSRANGPFIALNCGAIPESLVEAELFGAEKGAFTGAYKRQIGKLEAADKGTLFLDEIGELPLAMQTRLLRFLQEGTFSRIGSHQELKPDVRVLAATHQKLEESVKQKTFREDLYYRLNVIPVEMPALRERRDDIPKLVAYFIEQACKRHQQPSPEVPPEVLKYLIDRPWPGNVRELGNIIERLVVLADDKGIHLDDLEPTTSVSQGLQFQVPSDGMSWPVHEADCLRQALTLSDNNKAQAARLLDLPYKAFLYRLQKYHLLKD